MPSHFILLTVWGENSTCYSHSRVPNSLPDVGYRGHSSNLKKAAAAGKVSLLKQKRTNIAHYFIFSNFSNGFDITYSKIL